MEEIRPKKNWRYFYAILCHAMPYAPSGYLVVVFFNYCLSPPRENLPWRLKSNFEDHIFSHGIGSAKRPNQTLEVWDSSVGSRRVVASAYRCRVRPCCPKGPTNKCAPKQERSSKTWSFSFWQNTTRPTMCVCVVYIYISGCFRKQGYPQIIHFNRVFHYKPSILGYPYFWKHPYIYNYIYISFNITYWVDQILAPTGMSLVHKQKVANKPRKIKIILDITHNF